MSEGPLTGVRVLDLCWAAAGPIATKYLAMFGATVIKMESRRRLDALRMSRPYVGARPGINNSGVYANHNLAKLGVTCNLDSEEGLTLARRLVAHVDIVTENFTPGVMNRLGLSFADLAAINPQIIMVSLSLHGQEGPASAHLGVGDSAQSLSGIDSLTGHADGVPGGPSQMLPDPIAPWFFLAATLAALEHKRRHGRGQYIDLSLTETLVQLIAPELVRHQISGQAPQRRGNDDDCAVPHGVFPARPESDDAGDDRWVAISVLDSGQWQALCLAMGTPELIDDQRFRGPEQRHQNRAQLDRVIADWTVQRRAGEIVSGLQQSGVPAAIVATGRDLLEDVQLGARGHFLYLNHPTLGRQPFDGPSFRFSRLSAQTKRAPLFGEHNEEVYGRLLGLSGDELADLMAKGVIEAA